MKKVILMLSFIAFFGSAAYARDTIENYPINDVLSIEKYRNMLGSDVTFYFGDTSYGNVVKNFGQIGTNKKTNAFNKSDLEACQWVFMSAMKALKDRAIQEGGNAVVEIKSNYKNSLTSSRETFQCGAGALMAGVALTGKIVLLQR